jgi:quercetin dioxygenase-like cupin family protein
MLARDAPGEVTAAHTHPTPETLVVVEGEITFRAGEVEVTCRPGDRFLLPAETPHESVAGPDGCLYLIATRLIEAAG